MSHLNPVDKLGYQSTNTGIPVFRDILDPVDKQGPQQPDPGVSNVSELGKVLQGYDVTYPLVLQIVSATFLTRKFRFSFTDGHYTTNYGALVLDAGKMFARNELQQFTVFRADKYVVRRLKSGRNVIVVTNATVIEHHQTALVRDELSEIANKVIIPESQNDPYFVHQTPDDGVTHISESDSDMSLSSLENIPESDDEMDYKPQPPPLVSVVSLNLASSLPFKCQVTKSSGIETWKN